MGVSGLSMEEILKDKKSSDPHSITSLSLSHRALSDMSCLTLFTSLERLDLASNTLTSLEGLRSCVKLKWLSVVQNKLQSLKGIDSLSMLTVLNAGKNMLKSMEEVRSLVTLRALILNDNGIVSICKLDQLKELNTLVLSRNPIREIGESLYKVKSLTKLSLSNCQLETVGLSLKSCIELKELRLAHNDLKTLPAELAYNKKLQNLDLGSNVITRWSDVKVLSSLVDLKNLNLQGNPINEMDNVSKKVLNLLPNLHIFNARPFDKASKKGGSGRVDDLLTPANELAVPKEKRTSSVTESNLHDDASNVKIEKDMKKKRKKMENKLLEKEDVPIYETEDIMVETKLQRKKLERQDSGENEKQRKKKPNMKFSKKDVRAGEDDRTVVENKSKSKPSREKQSELDVIDNGDASFTDLFNVTDVEGSELSGKRNTDDQAGNVTVKVSAKKRKTKSRGQSSTFQLPAAIEVGMGGPSTWGDD